MSEEDRFIKDYKLFSDKPEVNDLKFAHETIVKWLEDIVLKSPKPYKLAITRSLGAGKSTIVNSVKESLEKNHSYKTAYVDVWKLDKETSRRTAIIKIAKDLGVKPKEIDSLEENLYGSISEVSKVKPNKTIIDGISFWYWLLISIVFGVVIYCLLHLFKGDPSLSLKLGVSFLTILITTSIKLLDKTFINVQRTFNRAPMVGAEEFEESLEKILENKSLKKYQILLIFDNIDRADPDQSKEILTGISAFFEQKNEQSKKVMVLVPFAIGEQKNLTKKAIHKFFDAILPIPELVPEDLTVYTKDLLKKSGWNIRLQETAELINFGPYRTPREIKHFINKLISKYNLSCLMETTTAEDKKEPYLKKGAITEYPLVFVKLLICEDLYSGFLQNSSKKYLSLEDSLKPELISKNIDKKNDDTTNLEKFLNVTIDFPKKLPHSPDPYIYFKGADIVLQIPGSHLLSEALTLKETDKTKSYLQQDVNNQKHLEEILQYTLNKYRDNSQRVKNSLLTVIDSFDNSISSKKIKELINLEILNNPEIILPTIKISQILKISPPTDEGMENNEIWQEVDKLFKNKLSSEDGKESEMDWIIDYLSSLITQPNGVQRAGITAQHIPLEALLSEKFYNSFDNDYPGPFVSNAHIKDLMNMLSSNNIHETFNVAPLRHLDRIFETGIRNSNATITQEITNYLNNTWQFITQKVNTPEIDGDFFINLSLSIKGIPTDKKFTKNNWSAFGNHLNNNHTVFNKKFQSLKSEIFLFLLTTQSKVQFAGYPKIQTQFASFVSQISKKELQFVHQKLGDWEWAEHLKTNAIGQFRSLLKNEETLSYLILESKNEMADLLIENIQHFKDVNLEETLSQMPLNDEEKFCLEDLFMYMIGDPNGFREGYRNYFVNHLEKFKGLTDSEKFKSYVSFELSSTNEFQRIQTLIDWLKINNLQILNNESSNAEKRLVKQQSKWTEREFNDFYISTSNYTKETDSRIQQLIDKAVLNGIEQSENDALSNKFHKRIIEIVQNKLTWGDNRVGIYANSISKCPSLTEKQKEEFLKDLDKLKE